MAFFFRFVKHCLQLNALAGTRVLFWGFGRLGNRLSHGSPFLGGVGKTALSDPRSPADEFFRSPGLLAAIRHPLNRRLPFAGGLFPTSKMDIQFLVCLFVEEHLAVNCLRFSDKCRQSTVRGRQPCGL